MSNHETLNPNIVMPLEIKSKSIAQHTGAVSVKLTGSLDTATAPELERHSHRSWPAR
jgi:anti-anti-sigma regulatory factor